MPRQLTIELTEAEYQKVISAGAPHDVVLRGAEALTAPQPEEEEPVSKRSRRTVAEEAPSEENE